ncbi:hypothetical protein [Kineosporia sp. R_H_3]|uniref:hypothetical protein n=1 Tax=Kineosporia sp. R_H_3 TaxID=1961848 RepID=UPI000B4BEB12|nr:hypothetical protein [Kineosporia sp. R_H_3]
MPDDAHLPDDDSSVLGCDVTHDREGWWVELTVGFRDDVVRSRIGPYLTEKQARVAAEIIPRAAGRQAPPPTGL